MKVTQIFAAALIAVLLASGPQAQADADTWASTLQSKIADLNLSAEQKSGIAQAFNVADEAYSDAIASTRKTLAATLSDEQKTQLRDMADAELQRRLAGDMSERTKSIADLAGELGVTDTQKSAMQTALSALGDTLDGVDANLRSTLKSLLDKDQLATIASWL